MSGSPVVSIIMNCFNGDRFLREALNSVFDQSFDDFEIIFWDNQSTDKSRDIAVSFDSRLRYFQSQQFVTLG